MERTVLINMFDNVIAEKSNKWLVIQFWGANVFFNVQGRIVVKSPDTDVLVLLVHYFPNMKNTSELWFQTGLITSTKDCRRYIPVHELCLILVFGLDRLNHSIRDKSLNWLGGSFRALNIEFFPIPKNEEVVSHPVRAWSAGKISHTTELNAVFWQTVSRE
jgi:hypothetical protein